jgi:hypothetical protein
MTRSGTTHGTVRSIWRKRQTPRRLPGKPAASAIDLEKLAERLVEKLRESLVIENERTGRS